MRTRCRRPVQIPSQIIIGQRVEQNFLDRVPGAVNSAEDLRMHGCFWGDAAAKYLFWNIGVGGLVYILGKFGLFAADQDIHFGVGNLGHSQVRLGSLGSTQVVATGGTSVFAAPSVSPAYLGVGYIIG